MPLPYKSHLLNLEPAGSILFNMDMKKILLMLACVLTATVAASSMSFMTTPRSLTFLAYQNKTSQASFKVISPTGFEKNIKISKLPEWITCDPVEMKINRKLTPVVKVTANAGTMKPGQYTSEILLDNVTEGDPEETFSVPVNFTVIDEKDVINTTPRAVDITPGITKVVVINNPTDIAMDVNIQSSQFWVQVYPLSLDIQPKSTGLIWVKMNSTGLGGGTYNSVVKITSPLSTIELPVKSVISCGLEFNPETLMDSGPVSIKNVTKKIIVLKTWTTKGVEFSSKSLNLDPGQTKTLNIKFTEDKKPDYITFTVYNGTNKTYNLKVAK